MNSEITFEGSALNFRVRKTDVLVEQPDGVLKSIRHKSALVREDTNEPIAVVGKKFCVIQNKDLFPKVDDHIFETVGEEHRETAIINSAVAKGGQLCFREYSFPNIKYADTEGNILHRSDKVTDLGFQLRIINGFGGSSLKVLAGAIDAYCSNGMILGDLSTGYTQRHTSRADIRLPGLKRAVTRAIEIFHEHRDIFARYSSTNLSDPQAERIIEESKVVSTALGKKIFDRWLIEKGERGATAWALYSALTYYSSHDDGRFATRNTGGDHQAMTMLSRAKKVRAFVATPAFQDRLARAA